MSTIKAGKIQPPGDSDSLQIYTNATERMNISSGGLVGIGIATPTSLLHVGGTALITGAATLSSTLNVGGTALITGAATLSSTLNVGGLATLAGATSSAIISCGTAPTVGSHLCNKTYVDGQDIGVGQTWQTVTRAVGIEYTNSTGRSITASITCEHQNTSTTFISYVTTNGTTYVPVCESYDDGARRHTHMFVIPATQKYKIVNTVGVGALWRWVELR